MVNNVTQLKIQNLLLTIILAKTAAFCLKPKIIVPDIVEVKIAINEGFQMINLMKKGYSVNLPSFFKEKIAKGLTPERQ